MFQRFIREDTGQDIVEYALLGALIGIAAILDLAADCSERGCGVRRG